MFQLNDDSIFDQCICRRASNVKAMSLECDSSLVDESRLRSLVIKLGSQTESFNLDFCDNEINEKDFDEVLKSMTKAKTINIHQIKIKSQKKGTSIISLPELRSLTCYCNDPRIDLSVLKVSSKNLKRFTIYLKDCETSPSLNRFFKRNKGLTKVSLYGSFINIYAIRHLKQLSYLYIDECLEGNKTFVAICSLHNLEFLDVDITNVSTCAIKNLNKLTCLKKIVLRGQNNYDSSNHFETLAVLHIPNLQSMQLNLGNVATHEKTLLLFETNFSHLESLEMTFHENRNVFDFIACLRHLDSLHLNFTMYESSSSDSFSSKKFEPQFYQL